MVSNVERMRGRMTQQAKMRRILSYWTATAALYLFCVGLVLSEIGGGQLDRGVGHAVIAFGVLGPAVFFALIRYAAPLGIPNWKLAWAQAVFAVVYDLLLYAVLKSAHAAILIGMPVVIVFCAFSLRPRQTLVLGALAVIGLAVTATAVHLVDPGAFPAQGEAINFILATVGVVAVTSVTGDLHRLRRRLHGQADDLIAALAKIELLATTDELTSLSNRRHMHQLLDHEERRQVDQFRPTCIALIDVDHFKQINDRFGHDSGDEALRALSREARRMLRDGDTLARWGGEEFLLLMPATALADARAVLERMLVHVRTLPLASGTSNFRITFSAGVVECQPEERFADAIRRSDQAMYEAKARGRDVVVAG